jgi:WbqC-like protein family
VPERARTVSIVQSSYVPWKGYFDLMHSVDLFVLYDDAQYTRRDWRNRNRIKTKDGVQWLTIPVEVKGLYRARIRDIRVSDAGWPARHLARLRHAYARAPFLDTYAGALEHLYLETTTRFLSEINYRFLSTLAGLLGIETTLVWSDAYRLVDGRTERLVDLCRQTGAQRYLSGPSARTYLDEAMFEREGIEVVYADYSAYPEYPQLFPPFDHHVSILDLLLNVGPEAPRYMKSFGHGSPLITAGAR